MKSKAPTPGTQGSGTRLSHFEIGGDNPCSQHLSESHCLVTAFIGTRVRYLENSPANSNKHYAIRARTRVSDAVWVHRSALADTPDL
jgi:hypothetical protein